MRESYFDVYPGIWRHGDFIKIKSDGSAVIHGRSDAVINWGGVKMGTAEIYRAVDSVEEVQDSLLIDIRKDGEDYLPLFVVLEEGVELDDDLIKRIKKNVRGAAAPPRHMLGEILAVPDVPRTLNGKKLEVPVKKILVGTPPEKAASKDSLSNPDALYVFVELANTY